MKRPSLLLSILILASLVASCKRRDVTAPSTRPDVATPTAQKSEVRIAAAADLHFAMEQMIVDFQRGTPHITVNATYGSSGNFFAQLSNKAPFDLYLSADITYAEKLVAKGLTDGTAFRYAQGRIVIWSPKRLGLDLDTLGIGALNDPRVKKISIANPEHAPYGRAAIEAMKNLVVYEGVKDRLVYGENVSEAAQFVQSGAADVGIIAQSLAMSPTMKEGGNSWLVPAGAYSRIDQGGVILSWAQDAEAARKFKEFLLGSDGQAVLRQFGFSAPKD